MNSEEHLEDHETESLQGLYANQVPSESFEDRVVARLTDQGRLAPTSYPGSRRLGQLLRVAAAIVFFGLGVAFGGRSTSTESPDTALPDPSFVFLLHDVPGGPALDSPSELELVAAYTQWARETQRRTGEVSGLRLSDEVELLAPESTEMASADAPPGIVGFFTVPAQSWEEAVELARGHPHRSTGGWVEVRRIAPTR